MIKTNPLELASSVCFLECSSQHCYRVGMLTFVCSLGYALTSKNWSPGEKELFAAVQVTDSGWVCSENWEPPMLENT